MQTLYDGNYGTITQSSLPEDGYYDLNVSGLKNITTKSKEYFRGACISIDGDVFLRTQTSLHKLADDGSFTVLMRHQTYIYYDDIDICLFQTNTQVFIWDNDKGLVPLKSISKTFDRIVIIDGFAYATIHDGRIKLAKVDCGLDKVVDTVYVDTWCNENGVNSGAYGYGLKLRDEGLFFTFENRVNGMSYEVSIQVDTREKLTALNIYKSEGYLAL